MRKILTLIAGTMITGSLLAGGLVTNTNQSASWVRMPARNASIETDAAYYNPAGLMKMENGFHFSLSNQTIFQTRTITSTYPYLNDRVDGVRTYEGKVTAPFFPSIYAVYKMDKFAFSLGFMPIGGGGGATYEDGLPSFEMSQSDLVPSLASSFGVTQYKMDVYFKGSSTFLGYQGAVSYKLADWISISAGARFVTAKNTYEGYLRDVQVNPGGGESFVDASDIMTGIAGNATTAATSTTAIMGAVPASAGWTLAQAQTNGVITAPQRAQLEGALTAFGYPTSVNIATADAIFKGAARKYTNTATLLMDQEAKAEQSGSGIAPFFNVNISPTEDLNISVKYEMATKLELTNKTTSDLTTGFEGDDPTKPITKFPDGEKVRNDMPAMLAVGVQWKVSKFNLAAGLNYYWDNLADYGHTHDATINNSTDWPVAYDNSEIIDQNGLAFQFGAEYNVTDKILVSGGYSWANKGVNSKYQSDLTYGNSTNSIGLGGAYAINDKFRVNIGAGYTMYNKDTKVIGHYLGNTGLTAWETYTKSTMMFGIGVDINF